MQNKLVKKSRSYYAKTYFGKLISETLGQQASPKKWVFIIGCYNSGTTLLSSILSQHPEISSLPTEGAFITNGMKTPESYGWVRMWHKCLSEIEQDKNTPEDIAKKIKTNWGFWFDDKKPIYLEKSISNATRIEFLEYYFKPAYFIYIVRNGYAVSEGIRRKSNLKKWKTNIKTGQYPIDLCAQQWVKSDEYILKKLKHVDNAFYLSYEELAEDTQNILSKISDYIGIDDEPLIKVSQKTLNVVGYQSNIKNMNPLSLNRLNEDDIERINHIAGKKLQQKGYTLL